MKRLNVLVAYSSKEGLRKEFDELHCAREDDGEPPPDFFAEGDSSETIDAVMEALRSAGHEVKGAEGNSGFLEYLEKTRPDIVFNIAEGLTGDLREAYVPMLCERRGIPFTGSSPLTLGICLNKARTKEILSYYGISVSPFKTFHDDSEIDLSGLRFPLMIKPVSEGSSKGVFEDSFVEREDEAVERIKSKIEKYRQPVIAEEFLPGDEFTAAVLGNGKNTEVLPIVSINFDELPSCSKKIYSYEAKWIWDTPERPIEIFKCPAKISKNLRKNIEDIARKAFAVLDVKDWCRIDIRLDSAGTPNVIEINPLPGILPKPEDNSCFPKAARAAGYSYAEMINMALQNSCARHGIR
jgi:D-alanine-D-alanine ligase